ncbi:MAG: DUF104 domain-containing protein [Candidatus Hatepunaea meridiana]|nr:DUF104 domain-containing protein [Candidatus Hatepunaea meridiana]
MKTITAKYRGNSLLELLEEVDLPEDTELLVIIPEEDDERLMQSQLQRAAETVFSKLWDNNEDEVWSEYL